MTKSSRRNPRHPDRAALHLTVALGTPMKQHLLGTGKFIPLSAQGMNPAPTLALHHEKYTCHCCQMSLTTEPLHHHAHLTAVMDSGIALEGSFDLDAQRAVPGFSQYTADCILQVTLHCFFSFRASTALASSSLIYLFLQSSEMQYSCNSHWPDGGGVSHYGVLPPNREVPLLPLGWLGCSSSPVRCFSLLKGWKTFSPCIFVSFLLA